MRNPVLVITIALALAAPCTALAGKKKPNTPSGPKQYMQVQMHDAIISNVQQKGNAQTTGKPTNPTLNPALQGQTNKARIDPYKNFKFR